MTAGPKPICVTLVSAALTLAALTLAAFARQAPVTASPPDGAPKAQHRREVTPEQRQKIESALPSDAPARPKKARTLLIVDYRATHPSVPSADLAVELMGSKTGAYRTVLSHDTSLLVADRLREFDAVYLNNMVGTAGEIFNTPELREGFAAYVRNGGGMVGNHATSVAAADWSEFTEILGATGAAHRSQTEKIFVKVNDPAHPLNAAFGGQGFEFTGEVFRFKSPSPLTRVHVLLSIDVAKTDMNQDRCTSNCVSDDGEYPISWVHSYGNGRVFYTSLGHDADVFWNPPLLRQFLAGIQFALGDLEAVTTPTVKAGAK
jgi:type 1 glutamine amidotransferase